MKTDKILQSLKTKHEQLLRQVSLLTAKKERIEKHLADAVAESTQTEEAILALEGKSSQIKQILEQAVQSAGWKSAPPIVVPADQLAIQENVVASSLPPAEKGFKWEKRINELGKEEDVLVPDALVGLGPEAYVVKAPPLLPPVEAVEFPEDPRAMF